MSQDLNIADREALGCSACINTAACRRPFSAPRLHASAGPRGTVVDQPVVSTLKHTCRTLVLQETLTNGLNGITGGTGIHTSPTTIVQHYLQRVTCIHCLYINDVTASYLSSPRVPNLAEKKRLALFVAIAWRCSLIIPESQKQ